MEKLDIYDEDMNFIGTEDRDVVHNKGYWHKTMECWLHNKNGDVFFQIRKEEKKLFATTSGHVMAGESVEQTVQREMFEELGIKVDINQIEFRNQVKWQQERIKNGKDYKDRIFSFFFTCCFDDKNTKFNFDENEVLGIVKVNAKKCLDLVSEKIDVIPATKFTNHGVEHITITRDDFICFQTETVDKKYGPKLQYIIDN